MWTRGSPIHYTGSVAAAVGGTVEPIIAVPQVPQGTKGAEGEGGDRWGEKSESLEWRTRPAGGMLTALCVARRMFSDIRQFHELFNLAGPDFTAQVAGPCMSQAGRREVGSCITCLLTDHAHDPLTRTTWAKSCVILSATVRPPLPSCCYCFSANSDPCPHLSRGPTGRGGRHRELRPSGLGQQLQPWGERREV